MDINNPLTIGKLKKWCEENNISDDAPIGIYMGAIERGSVSFEVIGDTQNEKQVVIITDGFQSEEIEEYKEED